MNKSFVSMWIFLIIMWITIILKKAVGSNLLFEFLWIVAVIGWLVSFVFEIRDLMK